MKPHSPTNETPEIPLVEVPPKVRTLPPPTDIFIDKPWLKLLVYGPPGAGKTTLGASAQSHPDLADVLAINFEGGLLSVPQHLRKKIGKSDIRSLDDLEALFWCLINKSPGYERFKTVLIDSGSEMETLSLENISKKEWDKEKKRPDKERKREGQDQLFIADYGMSTPRMKRIFRWFRDAPINVVVTALSKKVYKKAKTKDSEPTLLDVVPAFTDKLCESVRGYFDFVWYLYEDEIEQGDNKPPKKVRRMLTSDQGVFRAKTRGHEFAKKIGQVVDDPDLPRLFNALLEAEGFTPTKK